MNRGAQRYRCDNCNEQMSPAELCEHEYMCAPCLEAERLFNLQHADNEDA